MCTRNVRKALTGLYKFGFYDCEREIERDFVYTQVCVCGICMANKYHVLTQKFVVLDSSLFNDLFELTYALMYCLMLDNFHTRGK